MFQKSYEVNLDQIAKAGKTVGQDIAGIVKHLDPSKTVVAIGEDHFQLTQSFFQTRVMHEAKKSFAFSNSFELPEEDFKLAQQPDKALWQANFSTALKRVHHLDNYCYMSACLAPTYVLSQVNPTFLCADKVSPEDDQPDTYETLMARDEIMANDIYAYQAKQQNPLIHIGGGSHLFDCRFPGRNNLLDALLEDKQVILLSLIEEMDWKDQRKFQSDKINGLSSGLKNNLVAEISVKLPCYEVCGDSKVFGHWDKIVLANNAPELLLSKENKKRYRKSCDFN